MELETDEQGRLALVSKDMTLVGDFSQMLARITPKALSKELLVRAARLRGRAEGARAVDATAGLGEDALLLAASGYVVTMIERDETIAALTSDALRRAREDERLSEVASRMSLIVGDSTQLLPTLDAPIELVYLDPMFPRRRKAAATKKKLQLFRELEEEATEQQQRALLAAAQAANPRRIVVKRPRKGPYLANVKPSHSIEGKLIRYDCLTCRTD